MVGAGAVVSGKFEDGSVIVGNPGRIVKKVKVPSEAEMSEIMGNKDGK